VGQLVVAKLGGQVRQVLVTAWNPHTRAVRVAWPPQSGAIAERHRFSTASQVEIAESHYEPLDPDGFRAEANG
jgi:hypothetical protein